MRLWKWEEESTTNSRNPKAAIVSLCWDEREPGIRRAGPSPRRLGASEMKEFM